MAAAARGAGWRRLVRLAARHAALPAGAAAGGDHRPAGRLRPQWRPARPRRHGGAGQRRRGGGDGCADRAGRAGHRAGVQHRRHRAAGDRAHRRDRLHRGPGRARGGCAGAHRPRAATRPRSTRRWRPGRSGGGAAGQCAARSAALPDPGARGRGRRSRRWTPSAPRSRSWKPRCSTTRRRSRTRRCSSTTPPSARPSTAGWGCGRSISATWCSRVSSGIVTVTQIRPVSVTFTLPQQALPQVTQAIQAGPVQVEARLPDPAIPRPEGAPPPANPTGTLVTLDNQVDQATGTIRLKATFPNDDRRLWPGAFVNIRPAGRGAGRRDPPSRWWRCSAAPMAPMPSWCSRTTRCSSARWCWA
jgi:hypothetical protein